MSSSPPSTAITANNTTEILEVSSLPPSTSRFILPPPRSDLLDRLKLFLPKIKSANEALEARIQVEGEEAEEEGVIVQIIDSSDEDSSDEEEEEKEEEIEEEEEIVEGNKEADEGRLKRLMEISSGNKSSRKSSESTEEEGLTKKKSVGIVEI